MAREIYVRFSDPTWYKHHKERIRNHVKMHPYTQPSSDLERGSFYLKVPVGPPGAQEDYDISVDLLEDRIVIADDVYSPQTRSLTADLLRDLSSMTDIVVTTDDDE
jgi:hypothetical protein